ncbi:MAG: hypothetical protein N2315_05750 [Thermanaerothrix sp.]|nr:hypothetical protein [Thermanaerothrix sp.]
MTGENTESIFYLLSRRTPEGRGLRWVFSIIFGALVLGEAYGGYLIAGASSVSPDTLRSASPEVAQKDAMDEVSFQRAYMELRRSSLQTAQLATASGINPFNKPPMAVEVPPLETAPALPGGSPIAPPPEVQPPMVTVKAIMILGDKAAAVADIEGDGQAVILRVGSSFDGGRGRVVSISTSGVRFRWKERIYDAALQSN